MSISRVGKTGRKGSMLIELCTSLAGASMVMLLGVTLIERSMHWTQSMQRLGNLQRELSQLAAQYRADFARAQKIDFQSSQVVVFSMPGKNVTYESKDGMVIRRSQRLDARAIETTTEESYAMGEGYEATFESPYLVVVVSNPAGEATSTRLRVQGKSSDARYQILEDKP